MAETWEDEFDFEDVPSTKKNQQKNSKNSNKVAHNNEFIDL